ncbi:MAG: type II toxin-antitoxin system VapC family toxin [Acidobacteriota bacterium]|nr:type II toxin-antitoxin system VapC family toxin [Acidobacteriota bacterium]
MGLILDTNALSAIADGHQSATKQFSRAHQVAIPVIVLGEYRFGIAQSRHQRKYELWLEELIACSEVLAVDEETAISYAVLRAQLKTSGTPIPSNDVWIAALCRQHSLPLLSRDRHFDFIKGLQRLNW